MASKPFEALAVTHPALITEWNHEKNKGLLPEMVSAGSGKRVWWKCRLGHEWKTAVYHRKAGHGCPYCAAGKIKTGLNDLRTMNPELSKEWDYGKNVGLSPQDVGRYSQKKIWWRCRLGHSWKTSVAKRTSGQSCPYCVGTKVWKGFNDLATTMPELFDQWDYERNGELHPEDITAGSNDKVWWMCRQGHSWQAAVYSRRAGHNCPYCAGNAVLPGYNDIRTKIPELISEWDFEKNTKITPEEVAPNSNRKIWWICVRNHSWQAAVCSRASGKGCPYCAGNKVLAGFNDLETVNPTLAAEWDYSRNGELTPKKVSASSHHYAWWIDDIGHSWKAQIANRNKGCGCPYCAGIQVLPGFNDLATLNSALADQWDSERNGKLLPSMVTAQSKRIVWWRCIKGHSWKATVSDRSRNGCPYCSNRRVLQGYNDLKTLHPELIIEWDYEKNNGLNPEAVTYRTRKKVWWKCREGHKWKSEVYNRHKGSDCPVCAMKKDHHPVTPGINDLLTVSPTLAAEWDSERNGNLTPEQVMPYSTKKVWWKCKKGHCWRSRIQIRQKGTGCPYCSGYINHRSRIVT